MLNGNANISDGIGLKIRSTKHLSSHEKASRKAFQDSFPLHRAAHVSSGLGKIARSVVKGVTTDPNNGGLKPNLAKRHY